MFGLPLMRILDVALFIILLFALVPIASKDNRRSQLFSIFILAGISNLYVIWRLGWVSYPILAVLTVSAVVAFQLDRLAVVDVSNVFLRIIGEQYLERMRDDIVKISKLENQADRTPENPELELQELYSEVKTNVRSGELIFSVLLSVLLMGAIKTDFSLPGMLGLSQANLLLEVFLLSLAIFVALRESLIDAIVYTSLDQIPEEGGVDFALRWQRAMCEGPWFLPSLVFIGGIALRLLSERMYLTGLYVTQLNVHHDYSDLEAVLKGISDLQQDFENEPELTQWMK